MRDEGQSSLIINHQLTIDGQCYDYHSFNQHDTAIQLPFCLRTLLHPEICSSPETVTAILNSPDSTGEPIQIQPTQALLPLPQAQLMLNDLAAINQQLTSGRQPRLPIGLLSSHPDSQKEQQRFGNLFNAIQVQRTPFIKLDHMPYEQIQLSNQCTIGNTTDTAELSAAGVLGWTLNPTDIEAAVLDGQLTVPLPEVIGIEVTGNSPTSMTDKQLVQTLGQQLQQLDIAGRFIEFYGTGLAQLTLKERQQIARALFSSGVACSFFPIDQQTLIGLAPEQTPTELLLLEQWAKAQQLWHQPEQPSPLYSQQHQLDLSTLSSSSQTLPSVPDAFPLTPPTPEPLQADSLRDSEILIANTHAAGPIHQAQILALLGNNISCTEISQGKGLHTKNPTTGQPCLPVPILFTGSNYGNGPDPQWAARSTRLRNIKAVVSESFAESHRHQLAGMGVLPLEFEAGDSWQALSLKGDETIELDLPEQLFPYEPVMMVIHRTNGRRELVELTLRLDTCEEISACSAGGIVRRSLQRSTPLQ